MHNKFFRTLFTAALAGCILLTASCGKNGTEPVVSVTGGATTMPTKQVTPGPTGTPGDATVYEYDFEKNSYGQVAMGGGGFVTGVFSTVESGLYYARTDVGGAYRYDAATSRWVSLSFDISEEDRGLLGVDGLAVNPTDASNIVMLCGTSYFSGGKTCIFVSNDYGESFTRVDVTEQIKCHGNGMGRQNGERIAMDPNNPKVILAGGRTGGLIKSTDGGLTWNSVEFPVVKTANENGICAILFDASSKDGAGNTSRIFVAVSEPGTNVYVTEDGGASWKPVEGLPQELYPQHLKMNSEGKVLIPYSGAEGPWNGANGALYCYDPQSQTAENLAPDNLSFGDVIVHPADPDQMVLCTINVWRMQPNGAYGDEFYVTKDGGKTWDNITSRMSISNNGVDWIGACAIHWCGSMMLDPVQTGKMMVVSGNGVFACDDIWAEKPAFYFAAHGIEETVPLEAVSIPDGPLVTAIGDYDGFVHYDIFEFPERMKQPVGTNSSIAVGGEHHEVWVRIGNGDRGQQLYYSLDAGMSWKQSAKSPVDGAVARGGYVTVSPDGKTILWTPENGTGVYRTTDYGQSWTACANISKGTYLVYDSVDNHLVYGSGNGCFWVSRDGGVSFERAYRQIGNDIRCAVVAGKAGVVYSAASMKGLLMSTDGGETITEISSVRWCSAVSTGKGLTEDVPALYIWGIPVGYDSKGVYMSLDGGESWRPMTEPGIEFGGPGNGKFVVGDNNVVGRCYMSTVGLGLIYFQYDAE